MADTFVRLLRDGRQEGEAAPLAIMEDGGRFRVLERAVGDTVMRRVATAVSNGRAQAKCLVIVASKHSPRSYFEDFEEELRQDSATWKPSSNAAQFGGASCDLLPRVCFVDCHSDPLGWKAPDRDQQLEEDERDSLTETTAAAAAGGGGGGRRAEGESPAVAREGRGEGGYTVVCSGTRERHQESEGMGAEEVPQREGRLTTGHGSSGEGLDAKQRRGAAAAFSSRVWRHMDDLAGLQEAILRLGQEAAPHARLLPPASLCVAFDSLDSLLRHSSSQLLLSFLSQLTWHPSISSVLCIASSLLLPPSLAASLRYLAHATLSVHPLPAAKGTSSALTAGAIRLKQKRRTGKLRELVEEFSLSRQSGAHFTLQVQSRSHALGVARTPIQAPVSEEAAAAEAVAAAASPQVPFRLGLTDKEREARSRVALPFEHQGQQGGIQIYNGRGGGVPGQATQVASKRDDSSRPQGVIVYTRDSDDEAPDSDEDVDDDLDI